MSNTITLIEESFERIKPYALEFSDYFYRLWFVSNPDIKPMFDGVNMRIQQQKLIASLALVVENLCNPEALTHALQILGASHFTFGTLAEHYPPVGNALVQTFEAFLGEEWTPELAQAWTDAYTMISHIMLEGAKHPEKYIDADVTFYEWLDSYKEIDPSLDRLANSITNFENGVQSQDIADQS